MRETEFQSMGNMEFKNQFGCACIRNFTGHIDRKWASKDIPRDFPTSKRVVVVSNGLDVDRLSSSVSMI